MPQGKDGAPRASTNDRKIMVFAGANAHKQVNCWNANIKGHEYLVGMVLRGLEY